MSGHADYLAVFILGVGIGVACTYKYFKEKYRMKEEEEVQSVKDYWRKMYGKEEKKTVNKNEGSEKEKTSTNSKSSLDATPRKERDTTKPKYNTYSKKTETVDAAEEEHPKEDDDSGGSDTGPDVYEIGFDEYFNNNGYAKTQLNYYTVNRMVTSEEERDVDDPEIVDDYHVLLGYVMESSGFMDDDNVATIYIRNDQLSADYEVNKLYAAYA